VDRKFEGVWKCPGRSLPEGGLLQEKSEETLAGERVVDNGCHSLLSLHVAGIAIPVTLKKKIK